MECSVSIRCILSSMHIVMIFANVLQHGYFYQKYMFAYQIQEKMSGRVLTAKDDFWEFFVCLIFVKHKSNNGESRRQKEKRESI